MAGSDFISVAAKDISVTLDLNGGLVRALEITRDGRTIRPLHAAPWLDEAAIQGDESLDLHLRRLAGDFFCVPFGASDVEVGPAHGWTANSRWRHLETTQEADGVSARFRLERNVMGATVEKTLRLRDGHPFLYETHALIGGQGNVPVANHAMIRLPAGGRLTFSPKRFAETPEGVPEPDAPRGRSALAYPVRADDPTHFPVPGGGTADITRYPFAERHEDVAMLVEGAGSRFGWIAAQHNDSGEIFLSLKNPIEFPSTVLWFSNGGRDYAPWNGRHIRVLGIEEVRALSTQGHRASIAPNRLTELGIPTALELAPEGRMELHNVIGAVSGVPGDEVVAAMPGDGNLALRFRSGETMDVPFDTAFLG